MKGREKMQLNKNQRLVGLVAILLILGGCQSEKPDTSDEKIETITEIAPEVDTDDGVESVVMFQLDELPEDTLRYVKYLGREEKFDVYYSTPYYNQMGGMDEMEEGLAFYFTTPSTFDVVKTGEMEPLLSPKVKLIDNQIYVMKPDSITVISNQFEEIELMEMPEVIAKEENLYGFDVSDDLSQFVYSNEEGLWYWNQDVAESLLLVQPTKYPDHHLADSSYYVMPTFINEGKEVIVDEGLYEGSSGYRICQIDTLTCDESPQGGGPVLERLNSDSKFLQYFTPNEGINPWQQHWMNLKTKTLIGQSLLELESDSGETRQIDDYLQVEDVMILAIGTRNEGKFFPKWIDIERYQIEEDGTLSFLEHLERVENIALYLIGMTPEGKVIYSHEDYDSEIAAGYLEIFITD